MNRRLALALATIAAVGTILAWPSPRVPSFADVRGAYRSSEAILLDRHGAPLHELRVDRTVRRLDWVPLAAVSRAFLDAVLAAEDRRFHQHAGVDWLAGASAAWDNLRRDRTRGASTITMQLAALLDRSLAAPATGRSLTQKWRQARAALALEHAWSKREILEAYVNLVPFRGELEGIDAAARGLFAKTADGLDGDEALLLAALVRSPGATRAKVVSRACALVAEEREARCARLERLAAIHLGSRSRSVSRFDAAPHLARELLAVPGVRIATTLDADLQRFARDTLVRHLAALASRHVEDGAVLVLDNATGETLAYVASSGVLSDAPHVDGITARRQAGSTLKPFLYALAIERRLLTAASVLDDSPLRLATPLGLYVPQNYDRDFRGLVTVRTALASSLNVPAVRTLLLTGIEPFHERLRELGLTTLDRLPEHYGYALALGSAEVSLFELANAYRAIANGGVWSPVRVLPSEAGADARSVIDPGAAFIVADILADRGARAPTFGLDSPLGTRSWAAVKTGTSKDMRDNWTVGFSARFTVGVWVGNFSGAPMRDVSGVSGAAPVWQEIMAHLHRGAPSTEPAPPRHLVAQPVEFGRALEPARMERFLSGTEMSNVLLADMAAADPRIAYPGNGTIMALDPDVPELRQRLALRATATAAGSSWWIDGIRIGDARRPLLWAPRAGRHRLALVDAGGEELDAVTFEVRGTAGTGDGRSQAAASTSQRAPAEALGTATR